MHSTTLRTWQHTHNFGTENRKNEKRTLQVVMLTVTMMIVEIGAGSVFGSMALTADGWHMGTHAAALGISLFAYIYARKQANNPRYSFGTGKMSDLGGFSSAIVLQVIALLMAAESFERLIQPQTIRFNEAILVAVLGLAINLYSAFLLGGHEDHHHEGGGHAHEHEHSHHPDDRDQNIRAAYLHVIADALTSVLAILALIAGKSFGWIWMDALMGIVGSVVITRWSWGLLRETGQTLLDSNPSEEMESEIRSLIEADADNLICDLHLWTIGHHRYAAVISLVTHFPQPVDHYKALVAKFDELVHISVEVNVCTSEPCKEPALSAAR